ncbi:MAG: response regulator [Anaerolineaceae bacterium]|nr:response regulator [Anaerolineaceae bacterium]
MADRVALVVDDAPANREFLERLLGQAQFTIRSAANGQAALAVIADLDELPLALVDMKLPDMRGVQLTVELRRRFPCCYIVIATMYDDRTTIEEAFASGCNIYLVKPYGFMELFQRLMKGEIQPEPTRIDTPVRYRANPPVQSSITFIYPIMNFTLQVMAV